MTKRHLLELGLGSLLAMLPVACSSGSDGNHTVIAIDESEPNDDPATATALVVGETGHGNVPDATDTDFWQVDLAQDEVVSIEVFANRLDQATWTAGANSAHVSVLDTDGTTLLLEQGSIEFDWNSNQDTDVVAFRAPAAGTYFIEVDVDDVVSTGGDYLVAVQDKAFAAPLQPEVELAGATGGNDSDATAEAIVPGTVLGYHVDDEADWYTFNVAVPSLVRFTMNAQRNGIYAGDDSFLDSEISLRDSTLTLLQGNDDTYYLDSCVEYAITTPGDYFIEVDECCGTGDSAYFLEFSSTPLASLAPAAEVEPDDSTVDAQAVASGDWVDAAIAPGDHDYYALTCVAGDRVQVQLFDSNLSQAATGGASLTLEDGLGNVLPSDSGGHLALTRTIVTAAGTYYVHVQSGDTTNYALRFTVTPATFETEPDDTVANAGSFDATDAASGVIDVAADADLYAFQAVAGVPVVFDCLADQNESPDGFTNESGFGSQLDPQLTVKDSLGTVLATNSSFDRNAVGIVDGLPTLTLVFLPAVSGTYYFEVTDHNGGSGTDFYYHVRHR